MIAYQLGDLPITAFSALMSRTIVGRLRIALLSFLLASMVVVTLVWKQMERLTVVESVILETALPALRLNQEIDRQITNIISHASSMTSDISQEQVNEVYTRMKIEKQILSDLFKKKNLDVIQQSAAFSGHFFTVDNLTEELFSLISQRSFIQSEIDTSIERLRDAKSRFVLAAESEHLDSWGRLNMLVQSSPISQEGLTDSLADLGTYVEVESQILQLFVLIDSLNDSATTEQLRRYEKRIEFITQNAAQALLSRRKTEALVNLSQTLDHLSAVLNGPSGMIANANRLIEIESHRSVLSNDIRKSVAKISELQRSLISSTESSINSVGAVLGTTISRTILICIMGFGIIIWTALFISQVVLKKQIADRMSKLSRTVERLSLGEIDVEVDTSGNDEISTIAKSLNRFKKNAKELLRSNADLERFAYVASHDLRTPIQAIHNLASWTIEDSKSDISGQTLENLELIISRTIRMRQLTNDLLEYAQLSKSDDNICSFDFRELCNDVIDLVSADRQFTFDLHIAVESIVGPVSPIRQILCNLVGNAIKHHDQNTGCIMISSKLDGNRLTISVQDDGPGIPTNYHDRIFEPFFRLRSQDEVSGSGMGLASVTRLVQTFEGTMELHSDPDNRRGATFIVSILLSDQDRRAESRGLKRSA